MEIGGHGTQTGRFSCSGEPNLSAPPRSAPIEAKGWFFDDDGRIRCKVGVLSEDFVPAPGKLYETKSIAFDLRTIWLRQALPDLDKQLEAIEDTRKFYRKKRFKLHRLLGRIGGNYGG